MFIVLGWIPPSNGKQGMITFAQANGEQPIQTLPILPNGQVATNDDYWNGFTVMAYIHPDWLPIVPGSLTRSFTRQETQHVVAAYDAPRCQERDVCKVHPGV